MSSVGQAVGPEAPIEQLRTRFAGALGCVLAVVIGTAVATSQGALIAGAIAGLAFCAVAIVVYVNDPIRALIGLWIVVLFSGSLSATVGYNSSSGQAVRETVEVFVVLFILLTAWRTLRTNVRLPPSRFIFPGVGIALLGLLGAVQHAVPFTVAVTGAFLGLKLWIMIGLTLLLPWQPGDAQRVFAVLVWVGLAIAALGVGDLLTGDAISGALHTSFVRYTPEGFRGEAVHSILTHPGEFSLLMSMLFALTFARFAARPSRSTLVFALLFATSVMLSLRLKGFLSIAVAVIVIGLVQAAGRNRGAVTGLLIGLLVVVVGYSVEGNVITKQVAAYTSSQASARARLYATGERIAIDDFPLGVGFGRFASYPSRLDYSPVYYQYGLNSVYGLSPSVPGDIDDTSWPSVIGETGYSGLVVYVIGLTLLFIAIIRRLRAVTPEARWVPLAALGMLVVLLIDSLGEATLFDWLAITTFVMILGPALVAGRVGPKEGARRKNILERMARAARPDSCQ
jgi:hypothetical protein